jgi:hypothetical protein
VRPSEARSHRERIRVLKSRRAKAVSAQRQSADGAEHQAIAAERSVRGFYAVAKPAATAEDRQSEHSEVCRDRAKEEYKMPEAGREPLRGGRARETSRPEGHSFPAWCASARQGNIL